MMCWIFTDLPAFAPSIYQGMLFSEQSHKNGPQSLFYSFDGNSSVARRTPPLFFACFRSELVSALE